MVTKMQESPSHVDLTHLFRSFEDTEIEVVLTRRIPRLEVAGTVLGPAEPGAKLKLRRWIAAILEREGYAKSSERVRDLAKALSTFVWRVTNSPHLTQKLPEDFYRQVRETVERLSSSGREKEAEQLLRSFKDLVMVRARKVILLALGPEPSYSVLDKLSPEEKALYEASRSLIREWLAQILPGGRGA